MADSQAGLQLRQRGLAVGAGGVLVQLIGVFMVMAGGGWAVLLLPVLASGALSALSYTSVKDHTDRSGAVSVVTVVLAAVAAMVHSGWGGVLVTVIGAAVLYLGNKQLAAGIRY
jgi:hypothetical protein